jgi:hypothetical protein
MATLVPQTSDCTTSVKAQWNNAEVHGLLDYLIEHRSEAKEKMQFKIATFDEAARRISHLLVGGAVKNGTMCQLKFRSVS